MNVNPAGSISGHKFYNNTDKINIINNNLLMIENELYRTVEPDNKRKREINDLIFGFINKIEGELKTDYGLPNKIKKELQVLNIKFGMAAMKSGDTDWESFNLSSEVHDNNELFVSQNYFALSLDELQTQGITAEKRTFAWNCCQYNFAHALIYSEMPAPADKMQEAFATHFEQYKKQGASESIAVAAANAKIAEKLCRNSFDTEKEALSDPLFIASRKLNRFYDDYIKCEKPEKDADLRLEGEILSKHMSVFIPTEVKVILNIS
jgi:hypothetical protein